MSTDIILVVIILLTHTWLVKSLWLLLSCDLSSLTDNRSAVPYGCSLSLGRFEQDSDSCCSFIQEGLLTIVLVYCWSWKENMRLHKCSSNLLLSKCDIKNFWVNNTYLNVFFPPEILVVTLSVVAGPNPLEVDARIDSWYVTPGWSWENMWWEAFEGSDTVSPGRCRGTEGSNECTPL